MVVLSAERKQALVALLASEGYKTVENCRSWVGPYFMIDADKKHARCLLCAHEDKIYRIRFQTSNCAYHLQHSHGLPLPSETSVSGPSTVSSLPSLFERMRKNEVQRKTLLALAFAEGRLCYSILRVPSVRKAFGISVSEHTMKKEIRKLAAEVRSEVLQRIKNSYAACLMCDSTQADNTTGSWLNFCVVYGKQSFFFKGLLWTESLTGDRICELLRQVVEEIESSARVIVVSFCSDNGSNFVSGIEGYIAQYRPWAFFVRCAAHSIQLIVKDAISQQLPDIMQQMAASLAPFRQQQVQKMFRTVQEMQPATTALRIIKPVEVRWNSFYDAARRILDRWPAYVSAVSGTTVAGQFCTETWKNKLTAFCTAMKPFAAATDAVQADAFQVISLWDVMSKAGSEVVEIARSTEDSLTREICIALKNAYCSRWHSNLNHSHLSTILTFLDPGKRRTLNIQRLQMDSRSKFVSFCLGFILKKESPSSTEVAVRTTAISLQIERELGDYTLSANVFSHLRSFETDFITYWTAALNRDLLIAGAVLAMADIACTQADVERTFSVEGQLVDGRHNISFELLECEMTIRLNARHVLGDVMESLKRDTAEMSSSSLSGDEEVQE
eukprot:ANDGO_07449.mRNA.1 hypothetical protein